MTVEPGKTLPRFAAIAAVIVVAAFAVSAYSIVQAHRSNCTARNTSLDVLRDVILLARPSQDELDRLPPDRRERSERFFSTSLARIAAARC